MKLFATIFARCATGLRRAGPAEAAAAPSHAERVSISEDAHTASQGTGRPAVGDVRWYRARRGAAPAQDPIAGARPSAGPVRSATPAGATARAAIAAYRAGMALAG